MLFTFKPRRNPAQGHKVAPEPEELPSECRLIRQQSSSKFLNFTSTCKSKSTPYNTVGPPLEGRWARAPRKHFQNTGILIELIDLERKRRLKWRKQLLRAQQTELELAYRKIRGSEKKDAFAGYLRDLALEALQADTTEEKLVNKLREESRNAFVKKLQEDGLAFPEPSMGCFGKDLLSEDALFLLEQKYELRMYHTPSGMNAKKIAEKRRTSTTSSTKTDPNTQRVSQSAAAQAAEEFWAELENEAQEKRGDDGGTSGGTSATSNLLKTLAAVLGSSVAESKQLTNLKGAKKQKGPKVASEEMRNELASAFGGLAGGLRGRMGEEKAAAERFQAGGAADDVSESSSDDGGGAARGPGGDVSSEDEVAKKLDEMKAKKQAQSAAIANLGKKKK